MAVSKVVTGTSMTIEVQKVLIKQEILCIAKSHSLI
jgi:hypothetical protein